MALLAPGLEPQQEAARAVAELQRNAIGFADCTLALGEAKRGELAVEVQKSFPIWRASAMGGPAAQWRRNVAVRLAATQHAVDGIAGVQFNLANLKKQRISEICINGAVAVCDKPLSEDVYPAIFSAMQYHPMATSEFVRQLYYLTAPPSARDVQRFWLDVVKDARGFVSPGEMIENSLICEAQELLNQDFWIPARVTATSDAALSLVLQACAEALVARVHGIVVFTFAGKTITNGPRLMRVFARAASGQSGYSTDGNRAPYCVSHVSFDRATKTMANSEVASAILFHNTAASRPKLARPLIADSAGPGLSHALFAVRSPFGHGELGKFMSVGLTRPATGDRTRGKKKKYPKKSR